MFREERPLWQKHKNQNVVEDVVSVMNKSQILQGCGNLENEFVFNLRGFPGTSDGKRVCLHCGTPRFNSWVGKIPWRRKWQPTPVLLPGKSHGLRSLVGYSPWGRKESDMTERLHFTSLQ